MASDNKSGPHSASDKEMDTLLEGINQLNLAGIYAPETYSSSERLPAEADIGGFFEWDLNDAYIDERFD